MWLSSRISTCVFLKTPGVETPDYLKILNCYLKTKKFKDFLQHNTTTIYVFVHTSLQYEYEFSKITYEIWNNTD